MPERLEQPAGLTLPAWMPELARLELSCHRACTRTIPAPEQLDKLALNPSLDLIQSPYRNLLPLLTYARRQDMERVAEGIELIMVWCDPASGALRFEVALPDHLLAIKLLAEGISPEEAAHEAGVTVAVIDAMLWEAVRMGIVLAPPSRLKRAGDRQAAEVFTLQWHLTQTCDLHCKHCYDRSPRPDFPFERALSLMQELREFCWQRLVRPQVTLTGGNPLMYPRFYELYRAAADNGLMIAILGNAVERSAIERLLEIQRPVYYQVSLEGLEEHNDRIRGPGNYRRTVEFLRMLTELGVPNLVMLTLTKANLDQVIPLARELEGITGALTFNRLTPFGEGARLAAATRDEYQAFLRSYVAALPDHPVLALKDNLLNTIFEEEGREPFGGCAGFGCGAAFNFLAVLCDGEVHACRKFPSPLGNLLQQSLCEIYDSELAARYRTGSTACSDCSLQAVCGGCLAVTAGYGLDPLTARDPYCTKEPTPKRT